MKPKTYLLLLSFAICFAFCDKSGKNCLNYSTAAVSEVSGPATALVNQEVDITVRYFFTNGCGSFEKLETSQTGNVIDVSVRAKYEGCVCTDILLSGETVYKFRASRPGSYQLNFERPHNTVLTHTITVN